MFSFHRLAETDFLRGTSAYLVIAVRLGLLVLNTGDHNVTSVILLTLAFLSPS